MLTAAPLLGLDFIAYNLATLDLYLQYTTNFPSGQAAGGLRAKKILLLPRNQKIGASTKSVGPNGPDFVIAAPPPPETVKRADMCFQCADK